jgi:hypothetical protein
MTFDEHLQEPETVLMYSRAHDLDLDGASSG